MIHKLRLERDALLDEREGGVILYMRDVYERVSVL
jgi:hypothetical protein